MIKPRRIGHATFETPDLEKAIDHYGKFMGLVVAEREKDRAFLATRVGQLAIQLDKADRAHCTKLSFGVAPGADFGELARARVYTPEVLRAVEQLEASAYAAARAPDAAGERVSATATEPSAPPAKPEVTLSPEYSRRARQRARERARMAASRLASLLAHVPL